MSTFLAQLQLDFNPLHHPILLMLAVALDSAHMWTVRDPLAPRTASGRRAATFLASRRSAALALTLSFRVGWA